MPRILFLCGLALPGCMLSTLGDRDLSPAKIRALREADMNVYGCFQLGGPPPSGNTTWIVYPKDQPAPVLFLPNCVVQMK